MPVRVCALLRSVRERSSLGDRGIWRKSQNEQESKEATDQRCFYITAWNCGVADVEGRVFLAGLPHRGSCALLVQQHGNSLSRHDRMPTVCVSRRLRGKTASGIRWPGSLVRSCQGASPGVVHLSRRGVGPWALPLDRGGPSASGFAEHCSTSITTVSSTTRLLPAESCIRLPSTTGSLTRHGLLTVVPYIITPLALLAPYEAPHHLSFGEGYRGAKLRWMVTA